MIPLVLKIAQLFGIDRAVAYTLASRGWQIIAGLITIIFIGHYLSPIQQGFYYTFSSILALQVFFELGLTYVILQFASHEKARLEWTLLRTLDGSEPAKERLSQLLHLSLRWYGIAALLMIVFIIPTGFILFGKSPDAAHAGKWQFAWFWLVITTGSALFMSPVFAILEGCGLVADIARLRTTQDITAYLMFWLALFLGAGLLAVPVLQTIRVVISFLWLLRHYRSFIGALTRPKDSTVPLSWWNEIWPMQWRIALSWISGFFIFNLFNPILFAYFGAAEAGKMGMSLSIAGALNLMSMTWVNTKIPMFGQLVALKKFAELDRLFFGMLKFALVVSMAGGSVLMLILSLLRKYHVPLSERVLDPIPFGLLLATAVVNVIVFSEAAYLRAYKEEPFLLNSLVGAIISALVCYVFGRSYGAIGMAYGYFGVTLLVGLTWATWVFRSKRKIWNTCC